VSSKGRKIFNAGLELTFRLLKYLVVHSGTSSLAAFPGSCSKSAAPYMERMELVVSDDTQGDDLDMLSEELVQSHLERNVIEPHQDKADQKVVFFPCSAPSMIDLVADLLNVLLEVVAEF
jgi:hypothetical protein